MTARGIYEITMSLIDERLESGMVDATSTAIYEKNAPYLLDLLQSELIQTNNYYKYYNIEKTEVTDNDGNYEEYEMPIDFFNAQQVVSIETDNEYDLGQFKWLGGNTLFVPDEFTGEITIAYYPIPASITSLDDDMVLDDLTCKTILSYGLASRLLVNENEGLANYYGQLYDEAKSRPRLQNPAFIQNIQDNYDSSLTF